MPSARHRNLTTTLALILALLVAACGGGADDSAADEAGAGDEAGGEEVADDPEEDAEPVTLVFSTWAADEELAVFEQLIEEFEEENPHITVETQIVAFGDYPTTIQTRLAGNEEPDVMFMSQLWYQGFADLGALADLSPYAEADESYELDDFNEDLAATGYFEDQLIWTPYGLDMSVLFYNEDAFDEAGLEYPDEDWTWDDLREAAAELTLDDGGGQPSQYGMFAQNGYGSGWNWVWGAGGKILNDDHTGSEFTSPETLEGLGYFADMLLEDGSIPPVDVQEQQGSATMFLSGSVAMGMYGHFLIPRLEAEEPFSWGTTMLAQGPEGRNSFVSGAGYTMSARTEHPDESWELISHLNGPEGQAEVMRIGAITPARESLYAGDEFTSREASVAFTEQAEHLTPLPIGPKWNEYFEAIQTELDPVYRGQVELEDAAATLDERIPQILAD